MRPARRTNLIARIAPFVVGLLIMVGAILVLIDPAPTCRGELMQPGSRCAKTDGSQFQTFDQRVAAARLGGYVMLGTGIVVIIFGTALTLVARRRTA